MNQKSNKLTVPDLISVGVFTALYFVFVTVATFACALLPGAVSYTHLTLPTT